VVVADLPTRDLGLLRAADFVPLLHQEFILVMGPGQSVTLISVVERENLRRPNDRRAPFRLVFQGKGPPPPPWTQGTYELSQPALGRLILFMSAKQPNAEGPLFEAVFC